MGASGRPSSCTDLPTRQRAEKELDQEINALMRKAEILDA
jgi:hypothetical protein